MKKKLTKTDLERYDSFGVESDIFTALLGKLGSGKTYLLVFAALSALRRGEPVFSNATFDLSAFPEFADVKFYKDIQAYTSRGFNERGRAVIYWSKLIDILSPEVRCGTLCFDELGTLENCPWALEIKLLNLRKSHLSVFATVQTKALASPGIRQFFNRCLIIKQKSPWFTWLWPAWRDQARPALVCELPFCSKDHGRLTRGDKPGKFPWKTTHYLCSDVDPEMLGNKKKLNSRGRFNVPFNIAVAKTYQSAKAIGTDALTAYENTKKKTYKQKDYPMAPKPPDKQIDMVEELSKLPF